jgi:hypothetical protein
VVRRLYFEWSQIESSDYARYVENLRRIGCPEVTIRDIIVADVNHLFAERRAREAVSPAHQWWRSQAEAQAERAYTAKLRSLEKERRLLLERLLGPAWTTSDAIYLEGAELRPLDGPVLAELSAETRAAVRRAERDHDEALGAHLQLGDAEVGPADPLVPARLRQRLRQELARLLTPEQLEEYLLRYSLLAAQLRADLATQPLAREEFRAVFRSLDSLDQQALAAQASPASPEPRSQEMLAHQKEEFLKQALGNERFQQWKLQQDPLYRRARAVVDSAGVNADRLVAIAAILRVTEDEERRIVADPELTSDEQLDQIAATRRAQRDSLRRLLGAEAYERFLEKQTRLWENPLP